MLSQLSALSAPHLSSNMPSVVASGPKRAPIKKKGPDLAEEVWRGSLASHLTKNGIGADERTANGFSLQR